MATTGPDGISGWKNISRYDINDDKNKRKKQNQLAQNALQKATPAPSATDNTRNKSSGGEKSSAVFSSGKPTVSNKSAGVFDSVKLPYEDTVAQKNAQKAADLKRQQEQYNAEKLAQKQAAQAKAAQEKYAREKYIAQMRQKQRDSHLTGTGMRSNPYTGTVKTPSANTQSQWKTGGNEQNKVYSTGPNREMAGTVKLNTSKPAVTAPKTAVSTTKPTGPNVQMGSITQSANKPLTKAQLEKLVYGMTGGVGPGKETAQTRLEGNPKKLYDAVKELPKNTGLNREISRTRLEGNPQAFHSAVKDMMTDMVSGIGQSRETSLSSPYDEKGIDFAEERYNLKYGTDNIKEVNHTNTYVTKDLRPETVVKEVESNLKKAQQKLDKIAVDKKEELNNLEFKKYMALANGSDSRDTEELNKQIKQTQADIKLLDVRDKKIAMFYELSRNDAKTLSQMDEDDILEYIKGNDYNPSYLSPFAKTARAANQGISNAKAIVDAVNGLNVKYNLEKDQFTIGDVATPNRGFKFKTKEISQTPNLYQHKIIVDKSQMKNLDDLQKDLLNVLDGKIISDETHEILKKFADESDAIKKAGKNLGKVGVGLDILDFAIIVDSDIRDDGKLGTDTVQEFFGTAANWAGDYVGGAAGAKAGAAIGTVFGPVGTVIGAALGAFAGAYLLSNIMEDAGRYVGENIDASDYTIERYHQRAK